MRLLFAVILAVAWPALAAAEGGDALVDRLIRTDSDLREAEAHVVQRQQGLDANADARTQKFFTAERAQWRKDHARICVEPRLGGETQVQAAKTCLERRYDDRLTDLGWAERAGVHPRLVERVIVQGETEFRSVAVFPQFQHADGTQFPANAQIEAVVASRLEQAQARWVRNGYATELFTAGIFYRLTYPSVRLMNIRLRMNDGEGLQPPGTWYQHQLLVDLQTGKLVPLDDVFVGGWRDRLADLLYRGIASAEAMRHLGQPDRAKLEAFVSDERRYRFWPDRFRVLIYDGELGAHTCAAQDLEFTFDDVEALIRTDGLLRKPLRRPLPKRRGMIDLGPSIAC